METEADSEANSEGVQLPDALHISNSVRSTGHFEAGIILRVRLENFMCHRVFDITLGKKVNFISGQNGSGENLLLVLAPSPRASSRR